ncbi:hypothetical protein BKA82DRAFT_816767 [Pisolithus tinctorius]|uniref:Uncharacterized protein n=1 Tax=Pisolithus tinctorius Marx 270 TaxID=870435 RepID=A0A0C3NW12_PISTI|nr:hypothetical protein BKA82DRAFT_816767 [Pisolithus tinctorius]KIN99358.1 hypothetical protein M404DRAFT_816767 [Pisolithus tinctorius Marx 270]
MDGPPRRQPFTPLFRSTERRLTGGRTHTDAQIILLLASSSATRHSVTDPKRVRWERAGSALSGLLAVLTLKTVPHVHTTQHSAIAVETQKAESSQSM